MPSCLHSLMKILWRFLLFSQPIILHSAETFTLLLLHLASLLRLWISMCPQQPNHDLWLREASVTICRFWSTNSNQKWKYYPNKNTDTVSHCFSRPQLASFSKVWKICSLNKRWIIRHSSINTWKRRQSLIVNAETSYKDHGQRISCKCMSK